MSTPSERAVNAAWAIVNTLMKNPEGGELPELGDIAFRCKTCGAPLHLEAHITTFALLIEREMKT